MRAQQCSIPLRTAIAHSAAVHYYCYTAVRGRHEKQSTGYKNVHETFAGKFQQKKKPHSKYGSPGKAVVCESN